MSNMTILVADDDPNVSEILDLYFTENDFKLIRAINGKEALQLLEATQPDLLLLDIMMPGMDGYEVCREVRKIKDIPISCYLQKMKSLTVY